MRHRKKVVCLESHSYYVTKQGDKPIFLSTISFQFYIPLFNTPKLKNITFLLALICRLLALISCGVYSSWDSKKKMDTNLATKPGSFIDLVMLQTFGEKDDQTYQQCLNLTWCLFRLKNFPYLFQSYLGSVLYWNYNCIP